MSKRDLCPIPYGLVQNCSERQTRSLPNLLPEQCPFSFLWVFIFSWPYESYMIPWCIYMSMHEHGIDMHKNIVKKSARIGRVKHTCLWMLLCIIEMYVSEVYGIICNCFRKYMEKACMCIMSLYVWLVWPV